MSKRDYYEVLGVDRDAGEDEIKKSYRRLAMQFHPDRNPDDASAEEKFKEATEAYEVLRDEDKRARYDQFGHAGVGAGAGAGFSGFGDFDLSDALRAFAQAFGGFGPFGGDPFFGGSAREPTGRARRRGADLQVRLRLGLEEIATGVEKRIKYKRFKTCETCGGTGAKSGEGVTVCPRCEGKGQVRHVHGSFFGQLVSVSTCPQCKGEGQVIKDACGECGGEGRTKFEETIKVKVPAGVKSGNYIPIRGEGDVGPRGGPTGDLLVLIDEKPHDHFQRRGDDILLGLTLTYPQAALGDKIEIPTLDGRASLTIPAGVQSGTTLRLAKKGIKSLSGRGVGDLLVRVRINTPQKPGARERELLEELRELEKQKSKRDPGLFDKMKDAFNR
jgi:molecular chaperone DnaJ